MQDLLINIGQQYVVEVRHIGGSDVNGALVRKRKEVVVI